MTVYFKIWDHIGIQCRCCENIGGSEKLLNGIRLLEQSDAAQHCFKKDIFRVLIISYGYFFFYLFFSSVILMKSHFTACHATVEAV